MMKSVNKREFKLTPPLTIPFQYPSTMPSPTSSTNYIITSNLAAASPSSGLFIIYLNIKLNV